MGQGASTTAALQQLNTTVSSGFGKLESQLDAQGLKLGFLVEHASRSKAKLVLGSTEAAEPLSLRTSRDAVCYFLPDLAAAEQRAVLQKLKLECIAHVGHVYKALACCLRSVGVYVRGRVKPLFGSSAAAASDVDEASQALQQLHSALQRLDISPADIAAALREIQKRMLVLDRTLPQQQRWWRGPLQGYTVFFKQVGRLCQGSTEITVWQNAMWEPSVRSLPFPDSGDVWFMIAAYKIAHDFMYTLDLDHQGRLRRNGVAVLEFGESKSDIGSRPTAIARAKKIALLARYLHRLQDHRADLHVINHLFLPKVHPALQAEPDLQYGFLTLKTHYFS